MPGPIAWRIPVMVILVIGVWWFFLALRLANWQQDWRFRVSKKEACTGSIALKVSFSLLIYIYHHSFLFKKRIDWSLIFHLGKSHNWLRGFDDRKSARTVFRRDICFLSFFLSFYLCFEREKWHPTRPGFLLTCLTGYRTSALPEDEGC